MQKLRIFGLSALAACPRSSPRLGHGMNMPKNQHFCSCLEFMYAKASHFRPLCSCCLPEVLPKAWPWHEHIKTPALLLMPRIYLCKNLRIFGLSALAACPRSSPRPLFVFMFVSLFVFVFVFVFMFVSVFLCRPCLSMRRHISIYACTYI